MMEEFLSLENVTIRNLKDFKKIGEFENNICDNKYSKIISRVI